MHNVQYQKVEPVQFLKTKRKKIIISIFIFYYFKELLINICNRTPSIPVRIVPFFVHVNIGSGHASARQLSISIEPLTGRCVDRGNLIVNVG
jgi:hypothetical protein